MLDISVTSYKQRDYKSSRLDMKCTNLFQTVRQYLIFSFLWYVLSSQQQDVDNNVKSSTRIDQEWLSLIWHN